MASRSEIQLLKEVMTTRPGQRLLILLASCLATLLGLVGPLFQKEFVDRFGQADQLYFLLGAFICVLGSLAFSQWVTYLASVEAVHMQRSLSQKIYDKTLVLRTDSLGDRTIGEVVSVYTTDVTGATILLEQSLPQGATILFPLLFVPFFMSLMFSLPILPTVLVVSGLIVLNLFLAYRQSVFFNLFKSLAAERIGLVNEWIQNIRTLRILGWIEAFEKRIFAVRKSETFNRISMLNNGQTMNSVASSVTYVLNLTVLGSYIYLSNQPITRGSLLAFLWIVGVFLTRPFRQMPWFFTFVLDAWTSLKRVNTILQMQNLNPKERDQFFHKIKETSEKEACVIVKDLNLHIDGRHLLKNISFSVGRGEWVAIVGEVGSGKSLLLLSLLGETGCSFDQYKVMGNEGITMPADQLRQFFTFVPQQGFIMSANLRENVAFNYDTPSSQDEKIHQALLAAQFQDHLALDTQIGERGVNLSGGQRQRVSLARVDFLKAPIVLMDDCLSAVDVDTEDKLVNDLICGGWSERTRILVTHRLEVLKQVDRIFFMSEGRITASGNFSQLTKNSEAFRAFTASVAQEVSRVHTPEVLGEAAVPTEPIIPDGHDG